MNKKYKIIYADPPWEYRDKRNKHPRLCGGATVHYDTMTLKDIKSLPINEIGDDNSVLFLWVTFPNLREGLEVMQSWGYTYKTLGFNWIKLNKKNNKPFFGIGAYAKCLGGNSKIFILDTKTNKVKFICIRDLEKYDINSIKIHTHKGWKTIYNFQKNINTEVVSINYENTNIICSHNHRFFYKHITNVRRKDNVNLRIRKNKIVYNTVDNLKYKWITQRHCKNGTNLLHPLTHVENTIVLNKINEFELTDELAFIIGLFVAEGCFSSIKNNNGVRYSLCGDEIHLYEYIKNYIESLNIYNERYKNTKVKVNISKYTNKNGIEVNFSSKKFKSLIQSFISGKDCYTKRLNLDILLNTSISFRKGFLKGILIGDGTLQKNKYQRLTMCNDKLTDDIKILSESLGLFCRKYKIKSKCSNGKIFDEYLLSYKNGKTINYDGVEMIPLTIKSIENKNMVEDTYDISVEDECFMVDGILSHNSGSEICIMGVKGKVKAINNSVSSTILSPREGHSKKPDEVRDRIVKLFGDLPRIELFARQKAEGWDALGIELNSKDIRDELKDIILNQRYIVKNIITGEVKDYSVKELLEIINVDRTKDFEDYTYLDWKEGLEVLTEWEIVDRL